MKIYKAVKEFLWFSAKQVVENPEQNWIDEGLVKETTGPGPSEDSVDLDLNGDGKIDEKDASIAGKVLAKSRKGKKKGR